MSRRNLQRALYRVRRSFPPARGGALKMIGMSSFIHDAISKYGEWTLPARLGIYMAVDLLVTDGIERALDAGIVPAHMTVTDRSFADALAVIAVYCGGDADEAKRAVAVLCIIIDKVTGTGADGKKTAGKLLGAVKARPCWAPSWT